LGSLNVFTPSPNMAVLGSAWPFARRSSTAMGAESGWNPLWERAQSFISRYRIGIDPEAEENERLPCIFMAEDNPGDVDLLRVALEEHTVACELWVASDGERALRFIDEIGLESLGCPAIAILDLNLPKKTGRDLLMRMRVHDAWSTIPVVILSSSDSEKDKSDVAQLGASRYIKKPSSLDAFVGIGGVLKEMLAGRV